MPVKTLEQTVIIQATFPANLPANNKVFATMLLDPALGATSQVTIPANEVWVLDDLFVSASQAVDAILEFQRNLSEVAFKSSPVNSLIVTNPARPRPAKTLWKGNDILTIAAQNLANIGSSATTITVYAKIKRFIQTS
jgi:hypothetical protein